MSKNFIVGKRNFRGHQNLSSQMVISSPDYSFQKDIVVRGQKRPTKKGSQLSTTQEY